MTVDATKGSLSVKFFDSKLGMNAEHPVWSSESPLQREQHWLSIVVKLRPVRTWGSGGDIDGL
jgi:hypothetical protein